MYADNFDGLALQMVLLSIHAVLIKDDFKRQEFERHMFCFVVGYYQRYAKGSFKESSSRTTKITSPCFF